MSEYFDGSTCARAKKSPVPGVMLYSGTYPKDHPYLSMTIEQLLDPDFIQRNSSKVPACWEPTR